MLVASQIRKENIAEYILYMWQVEDLIRANELDIDKIEQTVINAATLGDDRSKVVEWYESLIDMMKREGVQHKGHLLLTSTLVDDLADLHRRLMADPRFDTYHKLYYETLPLIVELRAKSGDNAPGEIETCLNALYGALFLRLRRQEISDATKKAFDTIARFIGTLSAYHKRDEEGALYENPTSKKPDGASNIPDSAPKTPDSASQY